MNIQLAIPVHYYNSQLRISIIELMKTIFAARTKIPVFYDSHRVGWVQTFLHDTDGDTILVSVDDKSIINDEYWIAKPLGMIETSDYTIQHFRGFIMKHKEEMEDETK